MSSLGTMWRSGWFPRPSPVDGAAAFARAAGEGEEEVLGEVGDDGVVGAFEGVIAEGGAGEFEGEFEFADAEGAGKDPGVGEAAGMEGTLELGESVGLGEDVEHGGIIEWSVVNCQWSVVPPSDGTTEAAVGFKSRRAKRETRRTHRGEKRVSYRHGRGRPCGRMVVPGHRGRNDRPWAGRPCHACGQPLQAKSTTVGSTSCSKSAKGRRMASSWVPALKVIMSSPVSCEAR